MTVIELALFFLAGFEKFKIIRAQTSIYLSVNFIIFLKMKIPILFTAVALGVTAYGEPLHGPNVNPSNLSVLTEWENFVGEPAGIIGDNLSANGWDVFLESGRFVENGPLPAMANALQRWVHAFDGDPSTGQNEGFPEVN